MYMVTVIFSLIQMKLLLLPGVFDYSSVLTLPPHMVSLPPQHNATTPFKILNVFFIFGRWDKYVISVREAKALPKTNSHHWKNKYICVEGMLFAVFNKLQPS